MTPDEAAAVAVAISMLCAELADFGAVEVGALDLYGRPTTWATIDDPRTWMDFARREGLALDVDV